MASEDRQSFMVRSVVLLKCLQASGYFQQQDSSEKELSPEELYIGELLFHFQTGIQYNLHAVYQVSLSGHRRCHCVFQSGRPD